MTNSIAQARSRGVWTPHEALTSKAEKAAQRAEIEMLTNEYLQKGGKIALCETGDHVLEEVEGEGDE